MPSLTIMYSTITHNTGVTACQARETGYHLPINTVSFDKAEVPQSNR